MRTYLERVAERQVPAQQRDSIDDLAKLFKQGDDIPEGSGIVGSTKPFIQHPWVYAAITAIAKNVGRIPFVLYDGEEPLPVDDPWAELFARPNPLLSAYDLFYGTEVSLNSTGEALWVPIPGLLEGSTAEILLFTGRQITPVVKQNHFFGWRVTIGGTQESFAPEEVIHFKYWNPFDPVRGLSPITVARLSIDQDWWANKYNEAFFKNNAEPGTVISFPGEYNATLAKASRESWDKRHQGFARARKTAVLWGGATVKELIVSKRDMQFIEQKQRSMEEILAIFHVPPTEVMLTGASSSRIEEQRSSRRMFGEEVIAPELSLIETAINRWFMMRGLTVRGYFDRSQSAILQESLSEKLVHAKALKAMGWPLNMINESLDLGMKEVPWGDVALLPGTLVPANLLAEMKELPQKGAPPPEKALPVPEPRQIAAPAPAPLSPQQSKKLQRVLFEAQVSVLKAKDGGKPVNWERVERRLKDLVDRPEELVARLRAWSEQATKDEVQEAYRQMRTRSRDLARRGEPEPEEPEEPVEEDLGPEAIWRAYIKKIEPFELAFEKDYLGWLAKLEEDYLAKFNDAYREGGGLGEEREINLDWFHHKQELQRAAAPRLGDVIKQFGKCGELLGTPPGGTPEAAFRKQVAEAREEAKAPVKEFVELDDTIVDDGYIEWQDEDYAEALDKFLTSRKHSSSVRKYVGEFREQWQAGSSTARSQQVNRTLARVFGKDPKAEYLPSKFRRSQSFANPAQLRGITDAKAFAEETFTQVFGEKQVVYRGFKPTGTAGKDLVKKVEEALDEGRSVDVRQNTISSWTWDDDIAIDFAGDEGVVIRRTVRAEDVFSLDTSAQESEIVGLHLGKSTIIPVEDLQAIHLTLDDSQHREKTPVVIEPDAIAEFSDWLHKGGS